MNSLVDMEVATPSQLVPAVSSVAETLGNLMTMMLGAGDHGAAKSNATDNSTDAEEEYDPCAQVAVIDKVKKIYFMHRSLHASPEALI